MQIPDDVAEAAYRLPSGTFPGPSSEFRRRDHVVIAALAFLVAASHQSQYLLNPQFWAEDGAAWYADAYNHGALQVLFWSQGGYLHLFQRLIAAVAMPVPLEHAPLVFNVAALLCQVLVVVILVSSRFRHLVPNRSVRLVMGLVYLGLPGSWETYAILTTAHWHLLVAGCLIILADPPDTTIWRAADIAVMIFTVLSGPWSILLLPLVLFAWWRTRKRWALVLAAIISAGIVAQILTLPVAEAIHRNPGPLGASPLLLGELVGANLVLDCLIGEQGWSNIPTAIYGPVLVFGVATMAMGVYALALWRSPWQLRAFIIFSFALLAVCLSAPMVSQTEPQWILMGGFGVAARYWLLPKLSFLFSLLWLASGGGGHWGKWGATVLLLVLPVGMALDWAHPPLQDRDWPRYVEELRSAPSGTEVVIPVNPEGWIMALTKK